MLSHMISHLLSHMIHHIQGDTQDCMYLTLGEDVYVRNE
jgi:hypothetical protein